MSTPDSYNERYDVKSILLRFWHYRWVYVVVVSLFIIWAFLRNTFTPPMYENSTQVYIDLESMPLAQGRFEQFNAMNFMQNRSSLDNELGKMKSFPLIQRALSNLDYEVTYYAESSPFAGSFLEFEATTIQEEIASASPIQVKFYRAHNQLIDLPYYVEFLTDSTYRLSAMGEYVAAYNYIDNNVKLKVPHFVLNKEYKFGEEVKTAYCHFYVEKKENAHFRRFEDERLFFTFQHMDYLTLYYLNHLSIEQASPTSSLLTIYLTAPNAEKITEFLNQLVLVYLNRDLEEKNRKAVKTIRFIESQISDVASSLSYTGSALERFRSQNQVIDLDYQGQQMYETLTRLENEKASAEVQMKYYTQLLAYIEDNKFNELMAPSSANLQDPVLSNLLVRLTDLHSNRVINKQKNAKSLYLQDLNQQISTLQETVIEHIETSLKNIDITLNDIEYRIQNVSANLAKLPAAELELQSIRRRFELNDEIYNYLLTKRAEAQIAQASNFPSYEIVDPARMLNTQKIGPRTKVNYAIALFLGFFLPSAYILLVDFFNNRVRSIRELEQITNLPILGHIAHSRKTEQELSLTNNSYSITAESIRTLRTNVQLLGANLPSQFIVITSSTSHEGKTFSSINLAKSFSLLSKRVILVGYDLRKPRLAKMLNLSDSTGLSLFLTDKAPLEKVIQKTANPYLDIITEGPLLPNPTEIVASSASNKLISLLRQRYDYVIFDTSPVGVVPDGKLLIKEADICLMVVRQSKSKRHELKNTLKSFRQARHRHLYLVLNDFLPKHDRLHYMYKYYSDKPSNKLSKWFAWMQ